jgi:60 kDa SS-A/Ro ribonucleoprotein
MGRKSYVKTNLKREAKKNGMKSIKDVMTTSAVGTQVYEIQDPSARLIATIGAAMFNEPKYYPTDPVAQKREYTYDETDIDAHAQMIINTATEIAKSDNPRDLLAIANWARKEMKIRTTPQVLLAVAAHCDETKKYVRDYCKKIIERADELKDVFVASRSLFGSEKSLPNSLKRGLADAFQKFGEYDFLKYEGQNRPYFSDVLKMVDRAKDYPLPKALDHYLKTGEVLDEKVTPLVAARKALAKLDEFNAEAKALARQSSANWEVLVSQFGNKREIWEHLVNNKQLPYMATLRNLRNILQADVHQGVIDKVAEFLINQAVGSKQLPFRFISARNAILQGEQQGSYGYSVYNTKTFAQLNKKEQDLFVAVNEAVNQVVNAMPEIPGRTLVATDTSGSMDSPVSAKSQMSLKQAGIILAGIFAKKSTDAVVGAFADAWHPLKKTGYVGGALDVADAINAMGINGGTCAESVLRWAIENKEKFDRIVILSDMQTYDSANGGGYGYYSGLGRRQAKSTALSSKSMKELIDHYRKHINKDCKIHCIDLAGHSKSLVPEGDTQTNLVAGFSEKLVDTVLEFEGLKTMDHEGKPEQVFTLEYIRQNY